MDYPPPPHFPPGSYPPVALLYHQPMAIPRPAGVTAVAIVGIVLASLWILAGLGGMFSLVVMFSFVTPGMMPAGFSAIRAVFLWNGVSSLVSGLIAGWLLAVAIGCLRMRPWGRSGIVRYAMADLAWIAIKLAVALAWAIPTQQRWMNSMMNTATPATAPSPPSAPPGPATAPAAMSTVEFTAVNTSTGDTTTTTTTTITRAGGSSSTTSAAAMTRVGGPGDPFGIQYIMAFVTAIVSAIYPAVVLIYMTRPRIKGAFTPIAPGLGDRQQS